MCNIGMVTKTLQKTYLIKMREPITIWTKLSPEPKCFANRKQKSYLQMLIKITKNFANHYKLFENRWL